ncbi:MAG TPA: hypothetical protein VK118_08075 [Tetragenococcus sp.]|nr:hypothetical protein [Tetragenococcus sp.]
MKTNPNFYAQKISQVVQETETIGEKMNPDYELIRNLIDKDQLNQLSEEKRQIIVENFQAGTDQYQVLLDTLKSLRAPARVIGTHKKFEAAFSRYVAGCQAMVDSISLSTVDAVAFTAAEKEQDEATDTISAAIQKIMNLLAGR